MDRREASWFWPVFLGLLTVPVGLIAVSAVAGLMAIAALLGRASPGPDHPGGPVHAYPAVLPGPFPAPPTPNHATPSVPPVEGSLQVDVIVREVHGEGPLRQRDRCAVSIDFAGAPSGEGSCSGELVCGERRPWSVPAERALPCRATDRRVTLHDAGDADRPILSLTATPAGARITLVEPDRDFLAELASE